MVLQLVQSPMVVLCGLGILVQAVIVAKMEHAKQDYELQ